MKKNLFLTKNNKQLETLSKTCSLGHYQNKIYSKINKYFTYKQNSALIITLRLLFFTIKSLFHFNLPYKSEYSDNFCHILVLPEGGIGDHIYFLKYCYCLRKKFENTIKIDILLRENDKYLMDSLYKNVDYIDSVYGNQCPKHDIVINLRRFPEIKNVDIKRIKHVSSQDFVEYLSSIAQFKLENDEFYRSDFLGRCYSQIYKRTRENQADILDFLKMSSVTNFTLPIDESIIKNTLSKFGLSQDSYVILQTGGGHHFREVNRDTRQWPIEYYQKLISLLRNKHPKIKFVQCGESYHNHINNVDIDLIGKTTVEEVCALIKSAELLISAEGGYPIIRHFTSRQTSCVLFGPTDKNFFGFDENLNISANVCPGCEWCVRDWVGKCIRGETEQECMYNITPEYVFKQLQSREIL